RPTGLGGVGIDRLSDRLLVGSVVCRTCFPPGARGFGVGGTGSKEARPTGLGGVGIDRLSDRLFVGRASHRERVG
ncbi:MAG: hypothetical protein ACPGKS_08555, partial [Coraliomargarita sp.]